MQASTSQSSLPDGPSLDTFKVYLESILSLLISATEKEVALLLASPDFNAQLEKFTQEDAFKALYINKVRLSTQNALNLSELEAASFSYNATLQMSYNANQVATLALIKRTSALDLTRKLDTQLHVLNLFGPASADTIALTTDSSNETSRSSLTNPYESLHSLVHLAVAPYFDAYVNSKQAKRFHLESAHTSKSAKDSDARLGIPMTRKKFAELELSLLHLQQNVEVPDILLSVHPLVQKAIDNCHANQLKLSPEALDQSLMSDSSFLNQIQAEVNSWIKEIQNVTKLSREVSSGTASQEINFWLSMERALEGIDQQLKSEPIVLTMDILRHAKRFQATVSFVADTGLKEAADMVHKYNQLMKDFPLNELLAATDLDKMQEAVVLIFAHINKKLKLSPYPIRRALPLVEAISRDLNDQLIRVLGNLRIMNMEHDQFEKIMSATAAVFNTWDESIKEFTNVARETTRKRQEGFIPIKVASAHAKLQSRTAYLRHFRKQHEQLRQMLSPTKGLIGSGMIEISKVVVNDSDDGVNGFVEVELDEEVSMAYETVKNVDVLDTSDQGTEIWVAAEATYNERVSRVENQIIGQLRQHLGAARNAAAMFRVFSKFNALFVRPRIRGAIQEWQTQLIDSVKDDIRRLQDKFTASYRNSEAQQASQLRDIPPISGAIIWAKQIERQLYSHMRRVEDVLGKGWELYAEGQKLQAESTSFRRKLDTRPVFDAWLHEINRRDLQIYGRLFEVTKNRSKAGQYQLAVNFDPQIITLFKEVRNLIWLGFQVPHTTNNIAKDARRVYPHAVSLMETVRTYIQTVECVNANPMIAPLIAEFRSNAQDMLSKGMTYRWEHFTTFLTSTPSALDSSASTSNLAAREGRHGLFVKEFAAVVSTFQDRCDVLVEMGIDLQKITDEFSTCAIDSDTFAALLAGAQKIVDRLSLEGYANLSSWVTDLDSKIENILLSRLQEIITLFCYQLSNDAKEQQKDPPASFNFPKVKHEIRIQNQYIYLDPPLEHTRAHWYTVLQAWLGMVCILPRIQASRYEIGLKIQTPSSDQQTYSSLLSRIEPNALAQPFALIETRVSEMTAYVDKWSKFQALWDLEPELVYERLGDSLALWQQLLLEIRKARATFDVSDTEKRFCRDLAVIKYDQVQGKVNAKYDAWQRDIMLRFGQKLAIAMRETYASIVKHRQELEKHSIDATSTAQAVSFITFVQELDSKYADWSEKISHFEPGQRILERHRFSFPADWLYVDAIDGEWLAFTDILARHRKSIAEQFSGLQVKILAEDRNVQQKVAELVREWEDGKPIQGSQKAQQALQIVQAFEGKVNVLKEECDLVNKAKDALKLENKTDDSLVPVLEEIRDLKTVWTALSGIWSSIADLRDTLWTSLQPRKLRQSLDVLLNSARELPSKMRQYAAFEYVQETLRLFLKANPLVAELKSDALRERHWRLLLKNLRVASTYSPSSMTLGSVWDLDLKRNENIVKEIVLQAQGELALEEFLKQVKDVWSNYNLELVTYQQKTRLIKGWDDLFAKCLENLSSIGAMKMSPYYRVFEEEASMWEDKLNRIHSLFDVWIDVQRQWVYLDGIFTGSADIKHLLPLESQRFASIDNEFLAVMKRVVKSPFVLDVLQLPGIQKSLERLAELLSKIQKALGEYLEKERASFPRFYFVGDEDLLEIIGNSKDITRVCKHLRKMFAGIANLELAKDAGEIVGMHSAEGEYVPFVKPIAFAQYPKINEWLAQVESAMQNALSSLLCTAFLELETFFSSNAFSKIELLDWINKYPAQLVILAVQIQWTDLTEKAFAANNIEGILQIAEHSLDLLADAVLMPLTAISRRKVEHLITEIVHERDVLRSLIRGKAESDKSLAWLYHLRFYLDLPKKRVRVQMSDNDFFYGWEYLGLTERLVQTPLTDKCYSTLTMALGDRLGGSPFGPAGTGKTESVKALGAHLGRFVLVFCCDETFDFQAMGRIFVGLCQVGAWGCFDEFNRLDEGILSAVSQQIQSIQMGLVDSADDKPRSIDLVGKSVKINPDTGIFITMNPGYAGRSNLPDNLKKLFRSMAMSRPDLELISQVMLFSQGFRSAEMLAAKVVPLFKLCQEQLSRQPHYDFGLRALKSVLVSAGQLKRATVAKAEGDHEAQSALATSVVEQEILIQSVRETMVPKLVADDALLLSGLLMDVFPGVDPGPVDLEELENLIATVCSQQHLSPTSAWLTKVLQLYQIQNIQHGIMLVGPSASGKTRAWRVLLAALEKFTHIESVAYVIEPKALSKEQLYGHLDPTTREWTDGLFTHILRKIIDNVRGEDSRRHWIVFDGDVDPEWVENLNSVLDDNKLLTLPNGERLAFPSNVRLVFEVETLKYATLATVSRCGMIWFSPETLSINCITEHHLKSLQTTSFESTEDNRFTSGVDDALEVQLAAADILRPFLLGTDSPLSLALDFAQSQAHIMDFTPMRAICSLFSLLNKSVRSIIAYNTTHPDFPLSTKQIETYVTKRLLLAIVWSFTGDCSLKIRRQMGAFLARNIDIELPNISGSTASLIDFDVDITSGVWEPWQNSVPSIEVEPHAILASDVVIPTLDTLRHEDVLYSWLEEHKPLLLCGPPGSGKTMTLFSALRKLPNMEVVGLNFSSATSIDLIIKTFDQYCEYRKTPNGTVLAPVAIGRWLVLFCDEINLPSMDQYGTQKVISFLRQLVEMNGFWRPADQSWVTLERIQFVGACNPPTDPGRVPLSHRFLRHAPLIMVDYPGEISLVQIYGTFVRAALKVIPTLRNFAEPLTSAMVDFYLASQAHFTPDVQSHYVYSPRELSRWVRGIYESLRPLESISLEGLVRIWAHEALRLFQDRLVHQSERRWTDATIDEIAMQRFPTIAKETALARPILFSNWTSRHYIPIDREELREFTKARLKVFYEEELDVPLVLFNDVLDHVLRIDRVFRQVQGHMLLIGVSGSGKTTLSRFVAWMNGLSIFQIKVSSRYTGEDFDEDLRTVLRRSGCKGEKICFIMDESNVLDSGFLERMNTLLANAEVPGLFEGDDLASLMTACKEGSTRDGLMLDTPEELYKWFTRQVARNLHVVFTMNPPDNGLSSRAATSPALYNRCVLDWFGDWSDQAYYQVATEFTSALDLDIAHYPVFESKESFPVAYQDLAFPPNHRTAIANALVFVHHSAHAINRQLQRQKGRTNFITPRHYLDFISQYVKLFSEKREELEEEQRHLNTGLDKLYTTVKQVEEMRVSLASKKSQLEAKNAEANEKLQKMVTDQQEAEQQKVASTELQTHLATQEAAIAERKAIVMQDLAAAEPAVVEAQAAVSNIKKQHLTEVRSMANPPEAVKMAMESVCTVIGHKIDSWKTVQGIIRREDFISSIVNFDTQRHMTPSLRRTMNNEFLNKPAYTYENVNRASKACGPLVKWVIAQVSFSEILDRVGPLRAEVDELEFQAQQTQQHAEELVRTIEALGISIAKYKDEYAVLISQTQSIKLEMERVATTVERSVTLLDSLESEKIRWQESSRNFEEAMSTVSGDVLLSAAFLAYAGYFDQGFRQDMIATWTNHLAQAHIIHKTDISLIEYLSSADGRAAWQSHSLPTDDLSIENAIILSRFNRYPLIIDPSGQATSFLTSFHKTRKLNVTSFTDEAFVKQLESSLRFGTPLLVQDVEHLDPVLNPVLNRELRRVGGRVLIRLGNQDVDFSPSFMLFLSTRDPSVDFGPDLASRVTFVNFTMTPASLRSQSLDAILKALNPDVDKKRTDVLKLQGEFKLRLRHLEKSLLLALSSATANILDDDKVIETLEILKRDATEISERMQAADSVIQDIESATTEYQPLANSCSAVYFALEQLVSLNHSYQFSLRHFLNIFNHLLGSIAIQHTESAEAKLKMLNRCLFSSVFQKTSRSLLYKDQIVLAMTLAEIKLRQDQVNFDDLEFFASSSSGGGLGSLTALPYYAEIISHHSQDTTGLSQHPHDAIRQIWPDADEKTHAIRSLLTVKAFQPDRMQQAVSHFISTVFDVDFLSHATYDLEDVIKNDVNANVPLVLASVPGLDAAYRIEDLLAEMRKTSEAQQCVSVALGSDEGITLADRAITAAVRQGSWVMIKNCHLAPAWLSTLEKRLQGLTTPNPLFRLFLVMEAVQAIPTSILRKSHVLMHEPSPGLRANLLELMSTVPPDVFSSGPSEKARVVFLLCWLQAVLTQRLRYAPLSFSKPYEFNDADFKAALARLNTWINRGARGKANVDPQDLPWNTMRFIISDYAMGGRVDEEQDLTILRNLVDYLFQPQSFHLGFQLTFAKPKDEFSYKLDEQISWNSFRDFVRKEIPEAEGPEVLGLPSLAAKVIAGKEADVMLASLRKMRPNVDDNIVGTNSSDTTDATPRWMAILQQVCEELLRCLPKGYQSDLRASELPRPLQNFLAREIRHLGNLQSQVIKDLQTLQSVASGSSRQTNHSRDLSTSLLQHSVPAAWSKFRAPSDRGVQEWVANVAERIRHLEAVSRGDMSSGLWLGGLMSPSGLLTALRQAAAHDLHCSLEHLQLNVSLEDGGSGQRLRGMRMQCAVYQEGMLKPNDGSSGELASVFIEWQLKDAESLPDDKTTYVAPVYLLADRSDLLFTASFKCREEDKLILTINGAALFAT